VCIKDYFVKYDVPHLVLGYGWLRNLARASKQQQKSAVRAIAANARYG